MSIAKRRSPSAAAMRAGIASSRSQGRILATPGVELPVGQRNFTGEVMLDENRPMIATPGIVRRVIVEGDLPEVGLGAIDERPGARLQRSGELMRTFFETTDVRHDLGNLAGIGRKCRGQVARRWGHDSQIASCRSHSADDENPPARRHLFAGRAAKSGDWRLERLASSGIWHGDAARRADR